MVAPPAPPVLLDQGWTVEDRVAYHRTSQGSAVMPYELFLALEQADSTELFRSDALSDRFGLIVIPADPRTNPDGLPVGVVKTSVPDGRWKGDWVGLSCSACHSSELSYQGRRVRIEGGSSHAFDFAGYIASLNAALAATRADEAKFARTAERMKVAGPEARAALRTSLDDASEHVHQYISRDAAMATPSGPGRMDALTLIHSRVLGNAMDRPENWVAALAPVKPPFLWNAPHSAWVQWTGFASDPMVRNATESMGVFLRVDLRSESPEKGLFECSVRSTARRPPAAASSSPRTAPSATRPTPTAGACRKSTASASSRTPSCPRRMSAPIRCSSRRPSSTASPSS
jgi:hypothetical protein